MNKLRGAVIVLLLVFCITMQGYAHERTDGGYYTLVDENGNTVYITGWGVDVGDQFLTENNKRYEVISISGDIAQSKFLGNVNLSKYANPEKIFFLVFCILLLHGLKPVVKLLFIILTLMNPIYLLTAKIVS